MISSQDTICTLCFETFKDPVILKCGHNLCEPCVKRAEALFSALHTLEPPSKKKGQEPEKLVPSVACPLCGKVSPVSECKPNITLRSVLSLTQNNSAVLEMPAAGTKVDGDEEDSEKAVCGFCKGPATIFCAFCGPLCQEHSDFLHVKGPLHSHELSKTPVKVMKTVQEAVKELKPENGSTNTLVLPLCKDHNKQMELFCSKCETLVCTHCILIGDHKGHECSSVVQAFKKTNERIEELLKHINEKAPECEELVKGYARLRSGAEKEHEAALATCKEAFKNFREVVDKCEAETEGEIEKLFKSFQEFVENRTTCLHSLKDECGLIQKSAESSAAKNELIRYSLFKSLKNLSEHLDVISSAMIPDDATICQIDVNKALMEKFNLVKVRSTFRMGCGRVVFYNLDFDAMERTRSVTSEIPTGNGTSHDGGAIYDNSRRMILSVSGNFNNGRNLKITRMTDATHGETTLMNDVIPYGTHGQYPVFDGVKYTYFFQSEDGENNRFGRVDMDTLTFEALPNLPTSQYREFASGCCQRGNVYILDRDLNVREFDTTENSWRTLRCSVPRPGRLMADPAEPNDLYCLCSDGRGLFRINIAEESQTHLSDSPSNFSLGANGEAILVRVTPTDFFVFCALSGGWHVFSSERNRWVPLRNWRNVRNGSGHIVMNPEGPHAMYHVDDSERWEIVDLSG